MTTEKPTSKAHSLLHAFVRDTVNLLHLAVLVFSVLLIVSISIDTFKNVDYINNPKFLKFEFWVCMLFILNFLVEMLISKNKKSFFFRNLLFFLVSIPFLPIIHHFHIEIDPLAAYILRYVPLIRGGYALALVVSWCTSNKATSLFMAYLATLTSAVYFSSLIFYVFEHNINPLVHDYWDSLWWALMDCTTVGCNIEAVTPVGKALSVIVAALGLLMFPVFTVYITNIITRVHQSHSSSDTKAY
ncbi:MAG: potassium channel family protein [Muribaculaceae bacterium]|nr:potassium channel family protein [Muribaculaceae bacterium]